jgi:hypothetical protein
MLKIHSNFHSIFTQLLANTTFGESSKTQPFFNYMKTTDQHNAIMGEKNAVSGNDENSVSFYR